MVFVKLFDIPTTNLRALSQGVIIEGVIKDSKYTSNINII